MARITIEDCLKAGYNKFVLVHLAAKRVIQLRRGKDLLIPTSNKEVVAALREIASGKVRMKKGDNLPGNDLEKEPESPDTGDNMHVSQSQELLDKM